MQETSLVVGRASVQKPDSVIWETIEVSESSREFMNLYSKLAYSSSRYLYFLLLYFDAQTGWEDNTTGTNITGKLLSANYNFEYNTSSPRTFSFTVVSDDVVKDFIYPDKVCKFFVGVTTDDDYNAINYFPIGAGLVDAPTWGYDATSNAFSFQAIDLGAILNGQRTGTLSYENYWKYNQDTSVKKNITGMLDNEVIQKMRYNVPYTDSSIEECMSSEGEEVKIQNEIISDCGSTVYDMFSKILENSMPYYSFFFDSNGIYNYRISPAADKSRYVQYEIPQELVISEASSIDYANLKNCVEVWGLTQDLTKVKDNSYSGELLHDGRTYTHPNGTQVVTSETVYSDRVVYACYNSVLPTTQAELETVGTYGEQWGANTTWIDDLDGKDLYITVNGISKEYKVEKIYYDDDYNVVYFNKDEDDDHFSFIGTGRQQYHGKAEQTDGEYGSESIGLIRSVLSGGDYENIDSDAKCESRAKWELYKATQLSETLTLSVVPFYIIQSGHIVKYRSLADGQEDIYLVEGVSCDIEEQGEMSITLSKFYSYYQE